MTSQFDDDERLFGRDLIDATQRWAGPVVDARVRHIESQLQQTQAQIVRDNAMRWLDADPQIGETWRKTNQQPEFIDWLNQPDPFSGQPRMRLIQRAFELGDATTVGNHFKAFAAQKIPERLRTRERLPEEPPAGHHPNTPMPNAQGKRTWTRQQVAQFYRDKAAGRYDGQEAEALRLEQDIPKAAAEGRIVDPPMTLTKGAAF
jgi:hypothetical protein